LRKCEAVTGLPWVSIVLPVILLSDIFLRLIYYLHNGSLQLDEAALARNILDRGTMALLGPLDYNQGAPVLFLLLVHAATTLFGSSEFALRLVPLLASFISLILFYLTAKLFIDEQYVPIAVIMFGFSYNLVYYSNEAKQYSTDVAVAVTLTYLSLRLLRPVEVHKTDVLLLGLAGVVAIFLSHPAVFVLVGIGTTLTILAARNRFIFLRNALGLVIVVWGACFVVNYLFFLRSLSSNEFLLNWWKHGFLPISMSTTAIKSWFDIGMSFLSYCDYGDGWQVFVLALTSVAVGVAITNKSAATLMITAYFVSALFASVMGKYPFSDRLSLYLIPFVILLAVKGLQISSYKKTVSVYAILALCLLVPSLRSLYHLVSQPIVNAEEVRLLLAYLHSYRRPNDHVYIYWGAEHAVKYYLREKDSQDEFVHYGVRSRDDRSKYIAAIDSMKQYPRVWFLFSAKNRDEEHFFLSFLSHIDGELLEQHHKPGASLYLYRFPHVGSERTLY